MCKTVEEYSFSSYNSFFKLDQIITKSSIQFLFPDITNYKDNFLSVHLHNIQDNFEFIDIKDKTFSDCLLNTKTKYNKNIDEIISDKMLFKQFIQDSRAITDITIREIAKVLNISKSTVANYCKK